MFIKKLHDKRISLEQINDSDRHNNLLNNLKTPKKYNFKDSLDKTKGKFYSVKITPICEKQEDNAYEITTVKIQLKSKTIYHSDKKENQQIAINPIQSFSDISSISRFSMFSIMTESLTSSQSHNSTANETNEDIYDALHYNNPSLPIGKENDERYKISFISGLKNDKFPKYNSAAKKRKYSCIRQVSEFSSKFKKISSVKRLYESNISFKSGTQSCYFKMYRESDIFLNCERYNELLIDSNQDDDVDTDDEQLKMAAESINRMLGKAIKERL